MAFAPSLVPRLSINAGEENRAWYQMHALDIAIPSVTIRMVRNDKFAEDNLLAKT